MLIQRILTLLFIVSVVIGGTLNFRSSNTVTGGIGRKQRKTQVQALIPDYSARMLIIRHSPDAIGHTDAALAMKAVEEAAKQGLKIKVIGHFYKEKITKEFISEQMKVEAQPGDTLIIYTIGHGSPQGGLANVGARVGVMKAMAAAAEENEQETFWWQLSCYAAAGLPPIDSLPEKQQHLFSALASSPANQPSYFNTQAQIMGKVFAAQIKEGPDIDPNQDGVITCSEMQGFLDTLQRGKGRLFFAAGADEEVFADLYIPSLIPIVGPHSGYSKKFIPKPR